MSSSGASPAGPVPTLNAAPVTQPAPDPSVTSSAAPPGPTAAAELGEVAFVTEVVDGDTIRITDGRRVRLIGIDTPERGQCGFGPASSNLRRLVEGRDVVLVTGARTDTDRYGRLLRYVEVDGMDAGRDQVGQGLAIARYDSRDGYGRHPREDDYIALDATAPDPSCGGADVASSVQPYPSRADAPSPTATPQPAVPAPATTQPTPQLTASSNPAQPRSATPHPLADLPAEPAGGQVHYANCAAVRAAGAAPLYAGQAGYSTSLDRDKDGVACE